jgi:hypothetical protein
MASLRLGSCCAILFSALLCNCGPRYEDGGGDGEAGESPGAGAGGSGGVSAGSGGVSSGGPNAGGSFAGTVDSAGTAGSEPAPESEPVLGCAAQAWPDAGAYYEPPTTVEAPTRRQFLLQTFTSYGLSNDGRVVVGDTRDPDTLAFFPISWTLSAGISALPVATLGEGAGIKASCNGSVVLVGDAPFDGVYRVDVPRWEDPLVIHGRLDMISMDPSASTIIDGRGQDRETNGEIVSYPRRWTAATGPVELKALPNTLIHQVAIDGSLVGSDTDELFRFYPADNTREPIGMAPVDGEPSSISVSTSGYAWIQSADLHRDSFLVWRPPAEPRSVTCPGQCWMVDLSSTGQVALLDASNDSAVSSWLWTERSGFVDLSATMERAGFDLHGRKLRAVAMSDDARAFTGYSFDPVSGGAGAFFYAVVPAGTYQSP